MFRRIKTMIFGLLMMGVCLYTIFTGDMGKDGNAMLIVFFLAGAALFAIGSRTILWGRPKPDE